MKRLILLVILLTMAACGPASLPAASPTEAPTAAPTSTPLPDPVEPVVPPTAMPLNFSPEDPANVVLDFTADLCSAEWSNSGEYLACPGDPGDTAEGYAAVLDGTILSDGTMVESPALLMIPPHGSRFGGLFGAYPELNIYPGDHFKAVLACQQFDSDCAISYALHYYDSYGNFQLVSSSLGPKSINSHNPAASTWTEVDIDLSYLAGYTVRFVLTIRTEGEPLAYPALWIAPHIQREAGAQPAPAPVIEPTATQDEESSQPGVIKGWVDLSSAPPYLNDPGTGNSSPVTVMFFNLDDATWWWIHSTLTHPYYQMTVPPGDYHVVAYAQGVGDVAYVTGGHTGSNPSCGQVLEVVTVPANGMAESIVIADWNWSCGGTAYRPEKPAQAPLP